VAGAAKIARLRAVAVVKDVRGNRLRVTLIKAWVNSPTPCVAPAVDHPRRRGSRSLFDSEAWSGIAADLARAGVAWREPGRDAADLGQQATMTARFAAAVASGVRSSGSLVKIRSPGLARRTTVASMGSEVPVRPRRTPAWRPSC
jgi:hypothetical protein